MQKGLILMHIKNLIKIEEKEGEIDWERERFNYLRGLNKPVEFQNNRANFQYLKLSNIKPLFHALTL